MQKLSHRVVLVKRTVPILLFTLPVIILIDAFENQTSILDSKIFAFSIESFIFLSILFILAHFFSYAVMVDQQNAGKIQRRKAYVDGKIRSLTSKPLIKIVLTMGIIVVIMTLLYILYISLHLSRDFDEVVLLNSIDFEKSM